MQAQDKESKTGSKQKKNKLENEKQLLKRQDSTKKD